jgi:hypothetical protein
MTDKLTPPEPSAAVRRRYSAAKFIATAGAGVATATVLVGLLASGPLSEYVEETRLGIVTCVAATTALAFFILALKVHSDAAKLEAQEFLEWGDRTHKQRTQGTFLRENGTEYTPSAKERAEWRAAERRAQENGTYFQK